MELIDLVFNFVSDWIKAHPSQTMAGSAFLLIVLVATNLKAAVAAGKAFADLLKRIPVVGKPLESRIEKIGDAFVDGMKQDDSPTVDTEALKADIDKKYPCPSLDNKQQE